MRDLAAKFARYFITGGVAAVVDTGLFAVLIAVGLPPLLAGSLSFFLAAIANFTLTSRFVFGQAAAAGRFPKFLAAALVGFCINIGVTLACIHLLGLPPVVAKVCGIGVAFVFNFALNVAVVFTRETMA